MTTTKEKSSAKRLRDADYANFDPLIAILQDYFTLTGQTEISFARYSGVSQPTINSIMNRKNFPGRVLLYTILCAVAEGSDNMICYKREEVEALCFEVIGLYPWERPKARYTVNRSGLMIFKNLLTNAFVDPKNNEAFQTLGISSQRLRDLMSDRNTTPTLEELREIGSNIYMIWNYKNLDYVDLKDLIFTANDDAPTDTKALTSILSEVLKEYSVDDITNHLYGQISEPRLEEIIDGDPPTEHELVLLDMALSFIDPDRDWALLGKAKELITA